MKRIGLYVIIFILVVLFRENICFFYGNILGVFKLDNNYYDAVINLKNLIVITVKILNKFYNITAGASPRPITKSYMILFHHFLHYDNVV